MRDENVAHDVDFEELAKITEGFSGSDIRELCRLAAINGMRDSMKDSYDNPKMGDITMEHFIRAFHTLRESKLRCGTLSLGRIDLD